MSSFIEVPERGRISLSVTPSGRHLVYRLLDGRVFEARLPPYTVSAWTVVDDATWLLVAQDDIVHLFTIPTLRTAARVHLDDNVHHIAVHPIQRAVALATGSQGNYETHGNLLWMTLPNMHVTPLLDIDREVIDCSFSSDGSLQFVLGARDECDDTYEAGAIGPPVVAIRVADLSLRLLGESERRALHTRREPG